MVVSTAELTPSKFTRTNPMPYGFRRYNAALTSALQTSLS